MPRLNGKRVGFTEEQKQFLRETYPIYGGRATYKAFTDRFGVEIEYDTLKSYCRRWLNLHVSKEFRRKDYDSRAMPIGTQRINCRGEVKTKVAPGRWVKSTHVVVNVPNGCVAFNLDRNKLNNDPDNIGVTTNSKFRTLRNCGMWSENPEITKTGLIWCDLKELHEKAAQRQLDGKIATKVAERT